MSDVILFTKALCPRCTAVKGRLTRAGESFKEISIDHYEGLAQLLIVANGYRTVPLIVRNGIAEPPMED